MTNQTQHAMDARQIMDAYWSSQVVTILEDGKQLTVTGARPVRRLSPDDPQLIEIDTVEPGKVGRLVVPEGRQFRVKIG